LAYIEGNLGTAVALQKMLWGGSAVGALGASIAQWTDVAPDSRLVTFGGVVGGGALAGGVVIWRKKHQVTQLRAAVLGDSLRRNAASLPDGGSHRDRLIASMRRDISGFERKLNDAPVRLGKLAQTGHNHASTAVDLLNRRALTSNVLWNSMSHLENMAGVADANTKLDRLSERLSAEVPLEFTDMYIAIQRKVVSAYEQFAANPMFTDRALLGSIEADISMLETLTRGAR
jgi:hypothetical protein